MRPAWRCVRVMRRRFACGAAMALCGAAMTLCGAITT